MTNGEDTIDTRKNAFYRILDATKGFTAWVSYYISSLSALALIITNTDPQSLPPAVATIAGGLGINLLSDLISRLALDKNLDSNDIIEELQRFLIESGITEALARDENEGRDLPFSEKVSLQDVLLAVEEGNQVIISKLVNQYEMLEKILLAQRNIFNLHIVSEDTIEVVITTYLKRLEFTHSENTIRTYRNAMTAFRATLANHGLPTKTSKISELSEDAVSWFATDMKAFSAATERLYLTAVTGLYEYIVAERLAELNLPRVRLLIRQRSRRPGQRLPQFSKDFIETVLNYVINLTVSTSTADNDENEQLVNLRDRAFLLTLADTGLRVHEACNLRRGDIDWNEGKAIIIGKGDRQAVVRFSRRSLRAVQDYLGARAALDGASGKPLPALPLFARHDKGAGKKVKPITTRTGQNIVSQRVAEAIGPEAVGTITPHSFRHYFVTTILQATGNLKLAQELARHRNIAVTQRYAHLSDDALDRGYWEVFEE